MNIMFGFMISMSIFFSMNVQAEKKNHGRHPASLKESKERKKNADKKIPDHYTEHLFNQAEESPAKIKDFQ